jgi:uncharacterized protein YecT (DUF1311 family)
MPVSACRSCQTLGLAVRARTTTKISTALVAAYCGLAAASPVDCSSTDYESQSKQNACACLQYQEEDRRLNDVYRQLIGRLTARENEALRREQRKWLARRDSDCREPLGPRSQAGNMYDMELCNCLAQVTSRRTKALSSWKPGAQ